MICPICKKEFEGKLGDKYFPFDQEKCQLLDLYKWICSEEYVIAESKQENEEDE